MKVCSPNLIANANCLTGLDLQPRPFFIPPVRPGLMGHPFKFFQGPSRRLRGKTSFSVRVFKLSIRLPIFIVKSPFINSLEYNQNQRGINYFSEILSVTLPYYVIPMLSPFTLPSSLPYVVIEAPNSISDIQIWNINLY